MYSLNVLQGDCRTPFIDAKNRHNS